MEISEEQLEQLVEKRAEEKFQKSKEQEKRDFFTSQEYEAYVNDLNIFFNNGGDERVPFFLRNNEGLKNQISETFYTLHKRGIFPGHPSWLMERHSIATNVRSKFYASQYV